SDKVSPIIEKWLDQFGDVGRVELSVAIDIDDEIGPAAHGVLKAGAKNSTQSTAARQAEQRGTGVRGFSRGLIGGAVVDYDNLGFIDAGNIPGNTPNHLRDGFFFVESGNRDDQFHLLWHPPGESSVESSLGRLTRMLTQQAYLNKRPVHSTKIFWVLL